MSFVYQRGPKGWREVVKAIAALLALGLFGLIMDWILGAPP